MIPETNTTPYRISSLKELPLIKEGTNKIKTLTYEQAYYVYRAKVIIQFVIDSLRYRRYMYSIRGIDVYDFSGNSFMYTPQYYEDMPKFFFSRKIGQDLVSGEINFIVHLYIPFNGRQYYSETFKLKAKSDIFY